MAASWENDSALKAANEQVAAGQKSGNKDQVAAGTKAQDAALANHGIVVYRGGNTSQTPTSQSTGGAAPTTGSGSGSAGSGASGTEPTLSEKVAALDAQREAKIAKNKSKNSNPASAMYGNAAQIYSSAQQQQKQQIDYAVNQGVKELQRAEEDAQKQFQTQQNQVDIDEAKALDNQALYAEARGDRGGIGQAQYGQIQATAMTNRRAINTARTELATNTARQIADLRAQGEFQKADAILQLTQNYLSQLNEIQMWEAEYNLTVEQMNEQIRQWNESFAVEVANLTGTYNGQKTRAAREAEAEIALGMLQAGYTLSEEQLANLLSVYNISGATAESIRTEAQAAKDKEKDAELVNIALTYAQNGIDLTEAQWAALERAGHSRAQVEQIIQAAKDAKKPKAVGNPSGGLPVGEDTVGRYDEVQAAAQAITNEHDLSAFLVSMVNNGSISQDEGEYLFALYGGGLPEYPKLSERTWVVVDDGGTNWGWGIDNNAIVKDQFGTKYRLDDLYDKLVGEGMSKSDAKTYVINLQKRLGI